MLTSFIFLEHFDIQSETASPKSGLLRAMLSRGSFSSLSRILFPRPLARSFTTAPVAATTSAVAFDVDGVLLRGKEALPRARAALHLLEHHNVCPT